MDSVYVLVCESINSAGKCMCSSVAVLSEWEPAASEAEAVLVHLKV